MVNYSISVWKEARNQFCDYILGDSRAKDLIRKMFQKLKRNPKIQVVLRPTQANFPTMAVALVISSKGKINFQTMVVSLNSSKS